MFAKSWTRARINDEIPHTATGKISKLTLRERLRDYRLPGIDAAE